MDTFLCVCERMSRASNNVTVMYDYVFVVNANVIQPSFPETFLLSSWVLNVSVILQSFCVHYPTNDLCALGGVILNKLKWRWCKGIPKKQQLRYP